MATNYSYENRFRSLAKTISWRVTATVTTMIIVYFMTGELVVALEIGSIEVVAKLLLGYFHERIWNQVPIGRKSTGGDYQI